MTREGFRRGLRLAASGAVALACGALALQIVSVGWSGLLLGDGRAEVAHSAWAGSANAASRAAEQLRLAGKAEQAQAAALDALGVSAQDSLALRTLAEIASQRGQRDVADTAMVLAARLGWRDGFAQLWLFQRAIEQGDAVTAANAGDALLRTRFHPELVEAPLYALIQTPEGRVALADRISGKPQWAETFLRGYRAPTKADSESFGALLIELKRIGALPPDSLVQGFFQDLVARGRFAEAQSVWHSLTDVSALDAGSAVVDGGFDLLAQQRAPWGPFGWRLREANGILVSTPSRSEFGNNPTLEVQAESRTTVPLTQLIALRPGRYELIYEVNQKQGPRHAFKWRIICLSGTAVLQKVASGPGAAGWTESHFAFAVPADCPGQVLSLQTGATGQLATIAFDSLRIVPTK